MGFIAVLLLYLLFLAFFEISFLLREVITDILTPISFDIE